MGSDKEDRCSECGRKLVLYHRHLSKRLAEDLHKLVALSDHAIARGHGPFVHVLTWRGGYGGDYAKLRFWGLIKKGDVRGEWAATDKGRRYCRGKIRVRATVLLFLDEPRGFGGPLISFRQALRLSREDVRRFEEYQQKDREV